MLRGLILDSLRAAAAARTSIGLSYCFREEWKPRKVGELHDFWSLASKDKLCAITDNPKCGKQRPLIMAWEIINRTVLFVSPHTGFTYHWTGANSL